jgi:hypothetical protein
VAEKVAPRPAARSAGRRSRTKPTTRTARTGHRRAAPTTTTALGEATPTTGTTGTTGTTTTTTGSGHATAANAAELAAAVSGQTLPRTPPDDGRAGEPPPQLRDAARLVLAGSRPCTRWPRRWPADRL